MSESNALYKRRYAAWAGRPNGAAPDYERCCVEVFPAERGANHHQCRKLRGFGPDEAYCKQHDPANVAAKQAAADEKYRLESNARRYGYYGRRFYDTLKLIAEGHNDARGLAADLINEFDAGAR